MEAGEFVNGFTSGVLLNKLGQKCSICEVKEGACIQCTKASCFTAFHVTCARKEKLLMPMKATQGSEAPMLTCFCEKHLPVRPGALLVTRLYNLIYR